jgi:beta-aspartyl-peptidase (threonine type)
MRTSLLALLFILPSFSLDQAQTPQKGSALAKHAPQQHKSIDELRDNLEEGIKHVLVSQIEAWNHGDLEGFMQGYWHSSDLTFFSGGIITNGWEPTLERYRQRYKSEGREMGKLEFQDLHIDLLSARSAVATGKFQLTLSDGKQPHGIFTLIFKRMPAGWRIVHDHTSSAE